MALDESCEHRADASCEVDDLFGFGLGNEAQSSEKLEARRDLADFSTGFGVALALLAGSVSVGAFTDEEDGLTGGA
jgi:hypothetical protein